MAKSSGMVEGSKKARASFGVARTGESGTEGPKVKSAGKEFRLARLNELRVGEVGAVAKEG